MLQIIRTLHANDAKLSLKSRTKHASGAKRSQDFCRETASGEGSADSFQVHVRELAHHPIGV
jgi:hypothetical protein